MQSGQSQETKTNSSTNRGKSLPSDHQPGDLSTVNSQSISSKKEESKVSEPKPKTVQSGESEYKTKSFMRELDAMQPDTDVSRTSGPIYKYKETDVGIDEFDGGAVIGANNYFTKESYSYSCIVEQPSDVIAVTFETIDTICDVLTREKLKPLEVTYPSEEELLEIYGETFRWEKFKQTLLQNTLYNSRQMRKEVNNPRGALPKIDFIPKNLVSYLRDGTPKTSFFIKKVKPEEAKSSISTNGGTAQMVSGKEEMEMKVEEEQSEFRQTFVEWGMGYLHTRPPPDDDFRIDLPPSSSKQSSKPQTPSQKSHNSLVVEEAQIPFDETEPPAAELPKNTEPTIGVEPSIPQLSEKSKSSRKMSSSSSHQEKNQMQRFIDMFGPNGISPALSRQLPSQTL